MQEQTRVREGLRRQKSEREEKGCQSAATGATLPAPTHNQCRRRKSSPLTLPRPAATSQCPPPENARGARAVRGNEHAAGLPKHCARVSQPVECTSPPARLRQCLNDEHAGHDRTTGEVAEKEVVVHRHVLHAHRELPRYWRRGTRGSGRRRGTDGISKGEASE